MKRRRYFDHIDLRVRDRVRAQQFYGKLLPAIGFTEDSSSQTWSTFEAPEEAEEKSEFFGFIEDPNHRPNKSRIAFWATSRAEVDRIAAVARNAGALNIEGPEICVDYTPDYYAVFFEDPDGNKLEVCYRARGAVAE